MATIRVKPDIVKPSGASGSLSELVVVRVFEVSGLDDIPADSRNVAALTARDAVTGITVPVLGDLFPNSIQTSNIWLSNFRAAGSNAVDLTATVQDLTAVDFRTDEVAWNVINVVVMYRRRCLLAPYLKSVQGSLREVEQVAFREPTPLEVAERLAANPLDPIAAYRPILITIGYKRRGSSVYVNGPAFFKKRFVDSIITYRRLELIDPELFNITFAGVVNGTPWRSLDERTCMILPAVSTTDDGIIWNTAYSILYREDTHDDFEYYLDINGDMPLEVAQDIDYNDWTLGEFKADGSKRNGWSRSVGGRGLADFNQVLPWIEGDVISAPNPYGWNSLMVYNAGG